MARSIKKSVKTTIAHVYAVDPKTMTLNEVNRVEFVGGLGERLAKSRALKESAFGDFVKVEDRRQTYRMDLDTFLAYAQPVDGSEDEDEDEDEVE